MAGLLSVLQAGDTFYEPFERHDVLPPHLYTSTVAEEDPTAFYNHTYPRTAAFPAHYRDYGMFLRPRSSNPSGAENTYISDVENRMETEGVANLGPRQFFTDSADTELPYFLLTPPGYDPSDTETAYPLLIVIHGAGGIGGSTPTWESKFMALDENRQQFPAFVLSPTFPARPVTNPDENNVLHTTQYFDAFMALIDELVENERIDAERIYSTGFSMGGNTTWTILFERPDLLAAAAPFAGGPGGTDATRTIALAEAFKDTAIWAGIGTHDFIGASWGSLGAMNYRMMYDKVRQAGHGAIRYWEVTDMDHSSNVHERRFLATVDWMFSLRRGDPIPAGFMHVPHDARVETGGSIRFEGYAFGRPEATHYEWKRDGVVLPGEDGPVLELENLTSAGAGRYTVTAHYPDGSSITSPSGRLSVYAERAPQVVSASGSVTALEGEGVTLEVQATGSLPITYSWAHDGVAIPGADGPTLSLSDLFLSDSGIYTLTMTNSEGTVTTSMELTVNKDFYYEYARLRAWIPDEDTLPVIRGILYAGNGAGSSNKHAANNPLLQEWALKHGFVVFGLQAGNLSENEHWDNFKTFSLDRLHDDLAAERPELPHAPVIFWGHSNGGQQAYGFARHFPERTIAFMVNKGASYQKEAGVDPWEVPSLMIAGGDDSETRRTNIKNLYREGRDQGAPWAWFEEYRQGHSDGNSMHLAFSYFDEILPLRYPEDPDNVPTATAAPVLTPMNPADGWLIDSTHADWSTGYLSYRAQADYSGDPLDLGWVPTENMARLLRATVSYRTDNGLRFHNGKHFEITRPWNPKLFFDGAVGATVRYAPSETVRYSFNLINNPDWTEIRIYDRDEVIYTIPASGETHFDLELTLDPSKTSHAIHAEMDLSNGGKRTSFIIFAQVKETEPLAFLREPRGAAAFAGETVRLQASVSGSKPMTYQWSKDGTEIPGATEWMLELPDLSASDEGDYTLEVSGPGGQTLVSDPVTVSVGEGDTVWRRINFQDDTLPPPPGWLADTGALYGERGNGETYGWLETPGQARQRFHLDPPAPNFMHDGLIVMGNASWAIEVPNGLYRVRIVAGDPLFPDGQQSFSVNGAFVFNTATHEDHIYADGFVTVPVWEGQLLIESNAYADSPKINFIEIDRIHQTITDTEAVITATPESGLLPLEVDFSTHRSWIKTGETIQSASWDFGDGSASATGENAAHTFTDPGDFTVTLTLTDTSGAVSTDTRIISVGVPVPQITTQPEGVTLPVGDPLSLTVVAEGYGTLEYEWLRSGQVVSGETGATLSVASATTADSGSYVVRVTNAGGTVPSQTAGVTVVPVPPEPASVAAEAQGSSQVRVTWEPVGDFMENFTIERATGASGPWTEAGTTQAGTHSFTDTGLDPVTTYFYRVRAENQFWEGPFSAAVSAATEAVPGAEWTYTMDITLDGYQGTSALENFPLLVRLDENQSGFSFADFADAQGGDLRFVNGAGDRELAYEIDYWNVDGSAAVWVRVPVLSGTDTKIRALWGNPDATDPPSYTVNGTVWEGNYRAVWHLQEEANDRLDSTRFNHHASPIGPMAVQPGVVGNSARFDGSNGNTALQVGNDLPGTLRFTNGFTLEGWIRIDSGADTQKRQLFTAGDPYWDGGGYRADFNTSRHRTAIGTETGVANGNAREVHDATLDGGVPEEEWIHVAASWDGSTITTYINGQAIHSESFNYTIAYPQGPYPALVLGAGIFGDNTSLNRSLAGNLDEMRISDGTFSADWIQAVYQNIAETGQFQTLGTPETTAPPPVIDEQPQGLNINVGEEATFLVVASSDDPISYQWQKDGEDIPGAETASHTIHPAGVSDSGSYRVVVSNVNGSTLSAEAVLVVNGTVPAVSAWPTASSITFGQSLADSDLSGGSASVAGTFVFLTPGLEPGVGTAEQAVVFFPDDDFTYEPVEGTVSVEVEEAGAQIFFSNLTPTYNGEAQAPAVTTDPEGFSYALTFDGSPVVPVDADTYAVVAVITEEGATGSASDTFTIEPAPLTVQADDAAKFEGDPDPALSWSVISGELFGSDTLSGSLARDSGEDIGAYTIRQGTLSASGNYILTFQTGTLSILEAGDAPWVLQADFDDLNTGVLRGQGGWSGNNDNAAQVIQDPEDENNQVFRFAPSSNNHIQKDLSTPIQAGEVGTLFFRFHVPAGSSRINQQIRMPNNNPIRIKWDSDPSEPVLWIFGEDMSNTGLQQVEQTLARDTWYYFWMVIDNINGTYRIYIQGGDYPDQTFVTVADMGGDANSHPFQPGLIDALNFIGWNNGPMLYDDIYLAHGGENLSNPAAVIPPPSDYEQWLMDEGLDPATDPAAEEPGTGFTYRELHVMGARLQDGVWEELLVVDTPVFGAGSGMDIRVHARAGRTYRLFATDDLMNQEGWQAVGHPFPVTDTDREIDFQDPNPGDRRFYRVEVEWLEP
ncbi:MAG: DUF2341 domain-containing protein [Kiritimatiellae bacterium]|nr:DUF2341 domain-containing protein [Kiritimatiellia bacterium]